MIARRFLEVDADDCQKLRTMKMADVLPMVMLEVQFCDQTLASLMP